MKKQDIQIRSGNPACNVKANAFAYGLNLEAEFGCSPETAEKSLEFAWQNEPA